MLQTLQNTVQKKSIWKYCTIEKYIQMKKRKYKELKNI